MIYNGFPATYPQANQNAINFVQGEAGARAFLVGAGQSAILMDTDESVFYIKSADASGMPYPLRIFDYTERKPKEERGEFVTRKEFEELAAMIKAALGKENNGQSDL